MAAVAAALRGNARARAAIIRSEHLSLSLTAGDEGTGAAAGRPPLLLRLGGKAGAVEGGPVGSIEFRDSDFTTMRVRGLYVEPTGLRPPGQVRSQVLELGSGPHSIAGDAVPPSRV